VGHESPRLPWRTALLFTFVGAVAATALVRARSQGVTPIRSSEATRAAPAEPRVAPIVLNPQLGLSEADRAALRNMIRDEVRAGRAVDPSVDAAVSQQADLPKLAAQLTGDQRKVYDAAQSLVDQAIVHGSWTGDDRDHLRDGLVGIPEELRLEVVRPLIVAVNAGQVRFRGRGPLY
jgi:hypothetical protein